MTFCLHAQLQADTHPIGDLPLCRVLLMDNAQFPWLILVPRRGGLRELFELEANDAAQAMQEIRLASRQLARHTGADKINVAALGNMVPQLHIHLIARFHHDDAWPKPVWGAPGAIPYTPADAVTQQRALCALLQLPDITNL